AFTGSTEIGRFLTTGCLKHALLPSNLSMRNNWAKKIGSYLAISGSEMRLLCKNEQYMDKIVQNRQILSGVIRRRIDSDGCLGRAVGGKKP
ncbi:MAG: hypothetical protein ACXW6J_10130, partial [Candidatus Binatia bacterium]